jgi:hypothetical protein
LSLLGASHRAESGAGARVRIGPYSAGVRHKLRSHRDFARVWLGQHWKLAAGLIAIAGVLLSELPGTVGTVSTIVFAALGVAAALSDLIGYRRRRGDLHIMETTVVDPGTLQPGPSYRGAIIESVEDAHLLRDDRVDELLPHLATRVQHNRPDHDVPPELSDAQLPMLRFFRRHRGTSIYNAPAVRLETDLGRDQLEACQPGRVLDVEVRVTPFFAGIVTNEFAKWTVQSSATGQRWGGRSLTVSRQGVIRDLSQSSEPPRVRPRRPHPRAFARTRPGRGAADGRSRPW